MIHFFCLESDIGHEGKRLREILKLELPVQGIVFFGPHKKLFTIYSLCSAVFSVVQKLTKRLRSIQKTRCSLFFIFSLVSSITSCTPLMLRTDWISCCSASSVTTSPFSSHKKSRWRNSGSRYSPSNWLLYRK